MYIYWLTIFLASPIILYVFIDRKIFTENRKIFSKTLFGALIFGIPCDIIGTFLGIWFFPKKLIGLWLFGLPLEEYLFVFLATINLTYVTLWSLKNLRTNN
ncbi:MAG: hypothetical protein UY21_C0013G0024 [Microgenomates group bacterium GW2011_GWA1_48_10]|uniref:Lycopene cyclase domain-containing protein n=1 Tax=Candidatus Gottesmanbacteria bacterium RIFCSPHIGHO2_01_FULL_47_48 TaxID=1798381 RepID=A0A1F6A573_9BACT|nr:MAG: hypothetical protein UY21_C0013G0024 [Microgenomates group bacterium GW2011_GWA1_48_10]OGG19614.1 MAG: hypothetical protein A2721_02995 [Candidatus Gottesmanbacteria bacterium RIFCSPHIGHO2_01_FULL_47_48]